MERLTRDQIAKIFNNKELEPEEVLELIEKELGIKIDPTLPKEDQIDQVFEVYNKTLDKLDEERDKAEKEYKKKKKARKSQDKKITRKDYIIELISKAQYTRDELVELTDDYFNYDEGKSSRSRVGRVVRQLDKKGKLETGEKGILSLTGNPN